MNVTLTATTWMTGFTAGTTTTDPVPGGPAEFREGFQYGRASQLGDTHAAAGTRPYTSHDGEPDTAALLADLGEAGPLTTVSTDYLHTLVDAYETARDIRSQS